jgi:hypothetical protein
VNDSQTGSELAGEWLAFTGESGSELTRHAAEKLETYGIEGERLTSWWAALTGGESFVDVTTGTRALVIDWEGRPVDLSQHLTVQLKGMVRLVDMDSGAILFRHPTLKGIPDLVVEGDGYTLEFISHTLLCLDIQDPSGMARLLAEPVKAQLPISV